MQQLSIDRIDRRILEILQSTPGINATAIGEQIGFAKRSSRRYVYLGYWIDGCQSMSYKVNFQPHQILAGYPGDDVEPVWQPGDKGAVATDESSIEKGTS